MEIDIDGQEQFFHFVGNFCTMLPLGFRLSFALHLLPSHRFHALIVFFRGQTIRASIFQIKGETEYILK
jgi:hypothetical protein